MLMLLWFYFIPFVKFVFYIFALLCVLFSAFVMKRGRRRGNRELRSAAIVLLVIAAGKTFLVDPYVLRKWLLCDVGVPFLDCTVGSAHILMALGSGLMAVSLVGLFYLRHRAMKPNVPQPQIPPAQNNFAFWVSLSSVLVGMLICWTVAPWLGYLTVGYMPHIFVLVSWRPIAALALGVLIITFWKREECLSYYEAHRHGSGRKGAAYVPQTWTLQDTLWTAFWLFMLSLALAYVTYDILGGDMAAMGR